MEPGVDEQIEAARRDAFCEVRQSTFVLRKRLLWINLTYFFFAFRRTYMAVRIIFLFFPGWTIFFTYFMSVCPCVLFNGTNSRLFQTSNLKICFKSSALTCSWHFFRKMHRKRLENLVSSHKFEGRGLRFFVSLITSLNKLLI